MPNHLHQLLQLLNDPANLYELIPLLIIATLLCVTAAAIAYQFVALFFSRVTGGGRTKSVPVAKDEKRGLRGLLLKLLLPRADREKQDLVDEIRRLQALVAAGDHEKATLMEQNNKAQRRIVEMQREIEVLQGALNDRRRQLDEETDKYQALATHAQHLEKQLEEIVVELDRIYRNSTERPVSPSSPPASGMPASPSPSASPMSVQLPLPPLPNEPTESDKLKALLLAYRRRVDERKI